MPAKDYAATRYSGLTEIDDGNVKDLQLAWSFDTKTDKGNEAAPLVVGDTMYVITPYPNKLYALDLRSPGTCSTQVSREQRSSGPRGEVQPSPPSRYRP